ncbi:MAG TPA: hypothetical protein VGL81_16975 [Polyangiaceae bacterium]|jgi:tetratricopeptide (TPR) repeat protein
MRAAFVLLAGLFSSAVVVSATRAEAADPVTAEALFREGRRAIEAGNYVVACAKFEESNRLDPAPGTLLNLADCEEGRGQLARAWQHFQQLYEELPPTDERRAIADSRARSLGRRTPKLRIVLSSLLPVTVKRDDTVLGPASLGASQPVDPGRHVIVVSSPGRWDQRYDLEIFEGQGKELSVSPGEPLRSPEAGSSETPSGFTFPGPPPEGAPSPAAAPDGGARRTAAFVLGGFGAASLVTGGVFGVAALSQLASSNAHCTGNLCASQDAINQFHSAQSLALVADVTMGVGIACLATAVVLGLTGSHHSHPSGEASLPLWLQGRF